jgi:hypothetical protein
MTALQILSQAQSILARHLPPDGITEAQCIKELLALLDGRNAVLLTRESEKLEDALSRFYKFQDFLRAEMIEKPRQDVIASLHADLAASQERERQLAERLANIAALTSGF